MGEPVPTPEELEHKHLTPSVQITALVVVATALALIVGIVLSLDMHKPIPLIVTGVGAAVAWAATALFRDRARMDLARGLVEAGHTERAIPLLKRLGSDDSYADEAGYLVAQAYDRSGQPKLALATYEAYLERYDRKKKHKGKWVVEARVRVDELRAELGVAAPGAEAAPAVRAQEAASKPELRCPFCRDTLDPEGVTAECADCQTPHHASCFEEQGGCAVYGCRSNRARARVAE